MGRVPWAVRVTERAFISFASADQKSALAVCEGLERKGVRCWVSTRDVSPGENYQAAIVQALQSARVLVLVFSARTNLSSEVSKELSLASAFKLPVMPLRIENATPQGALHYELATRQWIDAFENWQNAIGELVRSIRAIQPTALTVDAPSAPPPLSKGPKLRISEQAIEAARAALTDYIGPIALVLVRKAAIAADTIEDFHERLAANIKSTEHRSAFLTRLRRNLR